MQEEVERQEDTSQMHFKSLKIKTVLTLAVLIFSVAFNVNADSSVTEIEQSAINVLNGAYVPCINSADQAKYFKANYIKHMKKDVDTITIGSSHMLSVSSEDVGESSYANLAVGGANLQDKLSILGLLKYYDVKYKRVIFEIDFTTFTHHAFQVKDDNKMIALYGYDFSNIVNKVSDSMPKYDYDFNENYENLYRDVQPVDITIKYTKEKLPDNIYYYRPDASMGFPNYIHYFEEDFINNTREILTKVDEEYRDKHANEISKALIENLIKYFYENDIKVNLVITPRSNYEYDVIKVHESPLINEITDFTKELANKYGCKVSGSFNPYELGIKEEDFQDGFHLFPEVVSRVFDFKK